MSPPLNAGEPPKMDAVNFGACQQRAMNTIDPPTISSASRRGLVVVDIAAARAAQPLLSDIPPPIRRYSTMILTPTATASAM
jgi:hypothetical protein